MRQVLVIFSGRRWKIFEGNFVNSIIVNILRIAHESEVSFLI